MVEGMSKINYKGKEIIVTDYTNVGSSKEKTIELIKGVVEEFIDVKKHSPNSILGLTNVTNLRFDMDVLKEFKEAGAKTKPFEKKVALVGVKGLLKAGYNFVIGLTSSTYKAFETEQEAKDWLVSD